MSLRAAYIKCSKWSLIIQIIALSGSSIASLLLEMQPSIWNFSSLNFISEQLHFLHKAAIIAFTKDDTFCTEKKKVGLWNVLVSMLASLRTHGISRVHSLKIQCFLFVVNDMNNEGREEVGLLPCLYSSVWFIHSTKMYWICHMGQALC